MAAQSNSPSKFVANNVPRRVRVWNTVMALYLIAWGALGMYQNQIDLVERRVRIAVLHDGPAWLMAMAFVCGATVLLSVVVDHYDRRNNESAYRAFRWVAIRLGWCLVAASLISYVYLFFVGAHLGR
jgi:hypothetical protein